MAAIVKGNPTIWEDHTKAEVQTYIEEQIDSKQDIISDLGAIRAGSTAGATAYQKPDGGIPARDIAVGVIPDTSSFITKDVNNLTYYPKTTQVNQAIQNAVDEIPFIEGVGIGSAEQWDDYAIGDHAVATGLGTSTESSFSITGSANATSYTTSAAHGLKVGDIVNYGDKYAKIATVPNTTSFTTDVTLSTTALSGKKVNILTGVAYAQNSHTEGWKNIAGGSNAHAEGWATKSLGHTAHTEGRDSIANANYSHAEGRQTTAGGEGSHSEGYVTTTTNQGEHAEGKYNISISGTTIHTVGVGTNNNNKKNAHVITNDGKHYIPGVGGYLGTENTLSALNNCKDLATILNKKLTPIEFSVGGEPMYGIITDNFYEMGAAIVYVSDNKVGLENTECIFYIDKSAHIYKLQGTGELFIKGISDGDYNYILFLVKDPGGFMGVDKVTIIFLNGGDKLEYVNSASWNSNQIDQVAYDIYVDSTNMVSTTYSDLKSLRDNGQLIPGQQYRIIDFVTTTTQEETQSAGHPFDIIVTADSTNKLNENARAIQHTGDAYFVNSDLASWEIKYEMDEDENLAASIHSNFELISDGVTYLRDTSKDVGSYYAWTKGSQTIYTYNLSGDDVSCGYIDVYIDDYSTRGEITVVNGNNISANFYAIYHNQTGTTSSNTNTTITSTLSYSLNLTRQSQSDFTYNGDSYYGWYTEEEGNTYYTRTSSPYIGGSIFYVDIYDNFEFIGRINQQSSSAQISAYRGIITYMKDEFGNECPYDFKNIQFRRYKISTCIKASWMVSEYIGIKNYTSSPNYTINQNDSKYYYTFNDSLDTSIDLSCTGNCYDNVIPSSHNGYWNNIVMIKRYYDDDNIFNNKFGENNYNMTFEGGSNSNTFGNYCYNNTFYYGYRNNTFGNNCYANTFSYSCYANTFGNYCYYNTFDYYCYYNTFGSFCVNNTFGGSFQSNTFGASCQYNTFGNGCYANTFGNYCKSNTLSYDCTNNAFGNYCQSNTFGFSYRNNTFGNYCCYNTIGGGCRNNTFGNYCYYIIFGSQKNASASASPSQIKNYIRNVIVENGVQYVNLYCTGSTSSNDTTGYCQNIKVCEGIKGTSNNYKQLDITSNIGKNTYLIFDLGTEVTYEQLKSLRDNNSLTPGRQYRITDFVTTTTQEDTQSAGHPFDIIVTATSSNTLSEDAKAIQHVGDTYFANSDLAAWELKYEMDESDQLIASIHSNAYFLFSNLPGCYHRSSSDDVTLLGSHLYAWTNGLHTVYSDYENPDPDEDCVFFDDLFISYNDIHPITSINGNTIHANNHDDEDITFTRNSQADFTLYGTTYYNWVTGDYVNCYTTSSSPSIGDDLLIDIYWDYGMSYTGTEVSYNNQSSSSQISAYRGIITYMKDEFGNECPYDFKNIQFKRYKITACSIATWLVNKYYGIKNVGSSYSIDQNDSKYYYTFNYGECNDDTLSRNSHHNIIPSNNNGAWNNIVFIGGKCYENKFGVENFNMTFGGYCYNNTFGTNCNYNTFGTYCYSNIFGNYCNYNTFGNGCYNNTFGISCYYNTFGTSCYNNTFGTSCNHNTFGTNCNYNTFGTYCYTNTFNTYCYHNIFGSSCNYNTFGTYCTYNIFGTNCNSNTFGTNCNYNTFGTYCYSNIFGNYCNYNTFGNGCYYIMFGISDSAAYNSSGCRAYIRYVMIENGVQYVNLYCTSTTSSSNYCQNIYVSMGVKGTGTSSGRKNINITSKIGNTGKAVYQVSTSTVINV